MAAGVWLAWMLTCSVAPAAPTPVRAVTIDGKSIEGTFTGVGAAGAMLVEQGGHATELLPDELMHLKWSAANPVPTSERLPVLVHLSDGGRLPARIVSGSAGHITLKTRLTDALEIPLGAIAAIRYAGEENSEAREAFEHALAERDTPEDLLFLVREDRLTALRGVTESIGPDGGSFRWRDRQIPIAPDRTYGLVLAAGVGSSPRPQALCLLRDGSAWAGRITGGGPDSIRVALAGGPEVALPVAELSEIRFRSDRVVFLGDLKPASYTFEPFGVTRWPYRVDRSAANRPIRIGGQSFERGIGMHSKASLVYELPDRFRHLAVVIGIDDAVGPLGHVIFRVVADEKEVFDSGPVTGVDAPRAVLVPIDGARQLELIVEFGEQLDVGDQADWADARLIK